jgi:hypothetical protein
MCPPALHPEKAGPVDTRRENDDTRDEEERLLMGRDPSCPSPPDSRGNPGAVLYETQKVVLPKVTLIARRLSIEHQH